MSGKVVPVLLAAMLGLISASDAVVRVSCGESVEGSFAQAGQEDHYKAPFDVNDTFQVTVEPAGEVLQISKLVVLDPDENRIAWQIRGDARRYESPRLSAAGEYTVIVEGSTVGDYVLHLQCFSGDDELGGGQGDSPLEEEIQPVPQAGSNDPIASLEETATQGLEEVGEGFIKGIKEKSEDIIGGLFDGKERREERERELEEGEVIAALYDKKNHKGDRDIFFRNDSDLRDSALNDRADSVWVAPGCVVKLYAEPDYQGAQLVLKESFSNLKGTALGANSASSIELACAGE